MSVKTISSRDNTEFKHLLGLAEEAKTRREAGLTLLDGWHLIEAAVQAGYRPSKLIYVEGYDWSAAAALLHDVPRVVVSETLMRALSPVKSPTGLLATLAIPQPVQQAADFAILLEDIQDPGNLGALLRTAAAAGVGAAYLSKGCTDAWSPKALRGGQGAHFQMAIYERMVLTDVASAFPGTVYAATLGASTSLYQLDLRQSVAFAFGNEGAGLSPTLRSACHPFAVPMPGRVESLNVAAAAAICLFERVRQAQLAGSAA